VLDRNDNGPVYQVGDLIDGDVVPNEVPENAGDGYQVYTFTVTDDDVEDQYNTLE